MAVDREKVVETALKFIEKKRYDKAIVEYQKILAEDPNDPRILQKIAEAQLKGKFVPEAIETYARIGKLYTQKGFAQQAVSVYRQLRVIITEQAPQLEEKYAHVLPELARLHQQLGHVADTIRIWEEIAVRHQRAGRAADVSTALRQLIALDATNPLYRLRLAEELARARDIEGAIEQFKQAADQLIVQGRSDGALKVFERLLQIRPDPEVARRTAELYLDRGQPNDAMLALTKLQIAFQANQKDLPTLGLLARSFEQLGQPSKAIDVYRETVRLAREQNDKAARKLALERVLALAPQDEQVQRLVRANPPSSLPAPMPPSAPPESEAEVVVGGTAEVIVDDDGDINLDEADDIQLDDSEIEPASLGTQQAYQQQRRPVAVPPPPAPRGALPSAPQVPPRAPLPSAPLAPPARAPLPSAPGAPQRLNVPVAPPRPAAPAVPAVPRPAAPAAPPRPAAPLAPPRPSAPSAPAFAPSAPVRPAAVQLHELDDLPDEPRSSGSVAVPSSMQAVEDFQQARASTDDDIDPEAFTQETLADVMSFRRARQPARAIECLHIALEVLPGSVALREQLRDVLLETGDRDGAIGEMISLATLAVEQGDVEQASAVLHEVLLLSPEHRRAREMLDELSDNGGLGYGGLEPVDEGGESAGAEGVAFDDEAIGADEGLSFDDEAVDADAGLSFDSEPRLAAASRRRPSSTPAPDLELTDDPFAETPRPASTRPVARPPSVRPPSARPPRPHTLPSRLSSIPPRPGAPIAPPRPRPVTVPPPPVGLELDEPDLTPAAPPIAMPPAALLPGQARPASAAPAAASPFDLDEPSFDDDVSTSAPDTFRPGEASVELPLDQDPTAKPAPMLAIARGFQGGDTLDDALEEVEFFASRGLVEDARAILLEQLGRFPGHPVLLDRLRELGGDPAVDATPQALSMRSLPPPPNHAVHVDDNLLDASLDALDTFEPTQEAQGHMAGQEEQVDVESVFAKFKEGVKAQVDDSDSATHYDLGFAYKQMGLLQDAIAELELAARDPARECVCRSMVGLIELERGRPDAAINAFLRALQAPEKTGEQELSLFYELGTLYEEKDNKALALDYFRRILRRDPDFRDIKERVAALEPKRAPASRSLDSEEDLDLVFDDILGSK